MLYRSIYSTTIKILGNKKIRACNASNVYVKLVWYVKFMNELAGTFTIKPTYC